MFSDDIAIEILKNINSSELFVALDELKIYTLGLSCYNEYKQRMTLRNHSLVPTLTDEFITPELNDTVNPDLMLTILLEVYFGFRNNKTYKKVDLATLNKLESKFIGLPNVN